MRSSSAVPRMSFTARYATHAMLEIAECGDVIAAATIVERQRLPAHTSSALHYTPTWSID